jgi:outer membrane protein
MSNKSILVNAALILMVANAADAAPANEVRLGFYAVQYDSRASNLTGAYVPDGVNVDVKDVNTLYLAYARTLSPHWVAELAFGVPPKTETVGKGPATLGSVPYDGQVVSTARWFAPTLLVNYVFGAEHRKLRPYIGLGVNYTHFYDRKSTEAGNAANGGPTAIALTDSKGVSYTAGVSYKLADRWHLYASYSKTKVASDYAGNTAGAIRRTHIDFRPSAFVLSTGYSF